MRNKQKRFLIRIGSFWLVVFGFLIIPIMSWGQTQDLPEALQVRLNELTIKLAEAEANSQFSLPGEDGWLFFTPEIRSLLVGPFWGDAAISASRATRPEYADPLPAILDFQKRLHEVGIELLLAPVPARAAVVPEKLLGSEVTIPKDWRFDANHAKFLKTLDEAGVHVLDLFPHFYETGQRGGAPVYCLTDTHWSGAGIQIAAVAIAEVVKSREWYEPPTETDMSLRTEVVDFVGDLTVMYPSLPQKSESVQVTLVRDSQGEPIPTSRDSEILLLGDSHTLVFHDASLYASGAGLPDHLAYQLGGPVDLIGVRGSGSTSARITLARQTGRLQGKKLVVWCFASREFTEATDGWRKVPLPSFDR